MKIRRATLLSNRSRSARKSSAEGASKGAIPPAASQTEALLTGVVSLCLMFVGSIFLGFASLFRKEPAKRICELANGKRILSPLLLTTAGAGIVAMFEPLTRLEKFDASDWAATAMLGSNAPNFIVRFGCAFTVGLLFQHGYTMLLRLVRSPKERPSFVALGSMLYFLVVVSAIIAMQLMNSVIDSSELFVTEAQHAMRIAGALSPVILVSIGGAACTTISGLGPRLGSWRDSKRLGRTMSLAILLAVVGLALPSVTVLCVAALTHSTEDFITQANDHPETRPLKAEFHIVGVNCANDREDANVMNCIFAADFKSSGPLSFDLHAANLIYARPFPQASVAERFSLQDGQGNPHSRHGNDTFVVKEPLGGDSGISEAGGATKSEHVVTIEPGRRLILRLRLHAPGDCSQFKRPYDLEHVYIKVKPIHQSLRTTEYLFIGPWKYRARELHDSLCEGSRPLPTDH